MSTIRINKLEDLSGNNGILVSDLNKTVQGALRVLKPALTFPNVRDNGSPLQVGDIITNLTDGFEYKYTGSGWLSTDISSLMKEQGAFQIGMKRNRLANSVKTVGEFLSMQWFFIQEFSDYITSKPDPSNPSTWDWAPAFQYALDNCAGSIVYCPPVHNYLLGSPARVPVNSEAYTTFIGDVDLTKIVLLPGNPTAFAFKSSVKGDYVKNIRIRGFIVDATNQGDVDGCIIFGGRQNAVEARGLNFKNIFLEDITAIGINSISTSGKFRQGIHMSSIFDSLADAPTVHYNIHLKRIRIEGGITGTFMGSGIPGTNEAPNFMDEIYIEDYFHDTLIPNAAYPAAGIQIGQDSYGRRLRIKNAYCANGGDVGIEINSFSDALVEDSVLYRPGTGFWAYNYHSQAIPGRQQIKWKNCKVIEPRNNPAWRIGQLQQGNLILDDCSVITTEAFDPRIIDFAAGTLVGLESLTIKNFKYFVTTGVKSDYAQLAGALSLHVNGNYKLTIDGFEVVYDGVAPRIDHEAVAIILNATANNPTVRVDIRGVKVTDKRTGTLLCSDAIRVYGTPKVIGNIELIVVDSTVTASQARHGLYVVNSSVPLPELNVSRSDFSGCTSLYEFRTASVAQKSNIFIDPQTVKRVSQLDATTLPSNPTVTAGTYDYINDKGIPIRINVSGGTGVVLSTSVDGTNYYTLNSNVYNLMPNERIRIVSTTVPSLRLIPQTRLTL